MPAASAGLNTSQAKVTCEEGNIRPCTWLETPVAGTQGSPHDMHAFLFSRLSSKLQSFPEFLTQTWLRQAAGRRQGSEL